MGHEIAYDFINQEINILREQPYLDLVAKIGNTEHKEFVAHDGNRYQLETEVFWDSKRGGDVRVTVCADGRGRVCICSALRGLRHGPGRNFAVIS